jgi:hypothetical protein
MGEKFDTPGPPPMDHGILPLDENDPRRYSMYGGAGTAYLEGPEGPTERQARWDFVNERWIDVNTGEPMPADWGAGIRPPR